jgi:hypothetical protein
VEWQWPVVAPAISRFLTGPLAPFGMTSPFFYTVRRLPFLLANPSVAVVDPIWAFAQAACDMCRCNIILRILKILSFRCALKAR